MNFEPNKHRIYQKGFTLIELMVVIVILGILAGVVVPRIMDNPDKARVAKARHDITALESALDLYRLDNYTYPSTEDGLEALINKPANAPNWKQGGYIKKLQKDPWQNDYQYEHDGAGNIEIYSFGADGAPSGEGVNADISSKDIEQ